MAAPKSRPGDEWPGNFLRWFAQHPYWTLALITLAALTPFLAKPFNIDDPLFIWTARQIHAHPANPYGFEVNWYGTLQPMWTVTKNPPLACYYLALAAAILGWSEMALHGAFLLPALAAVWGTYRLARHFCQCPLTAAMVTLFTPVFLVSSTSVMCDVMMLAFWVWAVVFWVEGTKRNDAWRLIGAGALIALAALTKYFGACLLPLLTAYTLISRRRSWKWMAGLLIPLAALVGFELATRSGYGGGLLSDAASYASTRMSPLGILTGDSAIIALSFTGGGLAIAIFLSPWLWKRRTAIVLGEAMVLIGMMVFGVGATLSPYGKIQGSDPLRMGIQVVFWATAGVGVIALAVADIWEQRNAGSWLLGLWVGGTFLFAAFINWTVNARSLLPMAPAVGILLARRLERNTGTKQGNTWFWCRCGRVMAILFGAALALAVTRADFLLAVAVCQNAQKVHARYGQPPGSLTFVGHWGFQYYMQALGAAAFDVIHPAVRFGDRFAVPSNNTNIPPWDGKTTKLLEIISTPGPRLLTTMNKATGGAFYASEWGPLPFAFDLAPLEKVAVFVFNTQATNSPGK